MNNSGVWRIELHQHHLRSYAVALQTGRAGARFPLVSLGFFID